LHRDDILIRARDGVRLAAWRYRAAGAGRQPCIIMSAGFGGLRAHTLPAFAERFAARGCSVLLYDHRGFGDSEGEPRLEADPFRQMHDMRDVVTFATLQADIDASRIGLWGNSYSGGHVLVVGALDRRVACVVSVVPLTHGAMVVRRVTGEAAYPARLEEFHAARRAEMLAGGETVYEPQSRNAETLAAWARLVPPRQNRVSVASNEMFAAYEPQAYVERIAPTPLLMVLTDNDTRLCTDLQLEAYAKAREPKRLVLLRGGHYDPYASLFEPTAAASLDWFGQHLLRRS
jgi:fermentation-respiration switch protein FrsA (DUF1100 family)